MNSRLIEATSSVLELVSVRTPAIVASSSSSTSVIEDSMTCAFAPGRTMLTEMTGESTSGNSRTESRVNAMNPNRIRARLTMLVSTGLRIDVSDSFTGQPLNFYLPGTD